MKSIKGALRPTLVVGHISLYPLVLIGKPIVDEFLSILLIVIEVVS